MSLSSHSSQFIPEKKKKKKERTELEHTDPETFPITNTLEAYLVTQLSMP